MSKMIKGKIVLIRPHVLQIHIVHSKSMIENQNVYIFKYDLKEIQSQWYYFFVY